MAKTDDKHIIAAANIPLSPPLEGDDVGSYRLVKLLGAGGMGTVFLAEHHSIGRRVAIKFLLPELARYPDIVGRFFDEARSVNRINNENIVEIFDFVRSPDGQAYLVMELLDGTDLYQTRKREGPYPLGRTLVICEQIASALSQAHKTGVVHRDLKPENVFLVKKRSRSDFVKLLDFGLAKLSEDLPTARQPTQAGIVMGTPGYMSPEQARGARVDGRSDVFSLGVLIHWMLADRVPEEGPDSEPPERNVNGDPLPDQLRMLVAGCIRLDPAQRPQAMDEVHELLTELRREVIGTEVLTVVPSRTASRSLEARPPEIAAAMRTADAINAGRAGTPKAAGLSAVDGRPGRSKLWVGTVLGAAMLTLLALGFAVLRGAFTPVAPNAWGLRPPLDPATAVTPDPAPTPRSERGPVPDLPPLPAPGGGNELGAGADAIGALDLTATDDLKAPNGKGGRRKPHKKPEAKPATNR